MRRRSAAFGILLYSMTTAPLSAQGPIGTTTPAATELGRMIQLMKASKWLDRTQKEQHD